MVQHKPEALAGYAGRDPSSVTGKGDMGTRLRLCPPSAHSSWLGWPLTQAPHPRRAESARVVREESGTQAAGLPAVT